MSKPILVNPPSNGELVTEIKQDGKISEAEVQLYYFTVSNTLKNYQRFKANKHMFRNTHACDKCYQIHSVEDDMYIHTVHDITLCEGCFEHINEPVKNNYDLIRNLVNEETGLKFRTN